jgi:hypothetical protein
VEEGEHGQDISTWAGICFHSPTNPEEGAATIININSKTLHIAIGDAGYVYLYIYCSSWNPWTDIDVLLSGIVYIYALSDDRSELRFSHRLENRHTNSASTSTGPEGHVTALEWTLDGMAIAVSWETRGVTVWSLFGRLLSSTYTEETKSSL